MKIPFVDRNTATNQLIQFSILFYWSLFWLFNIVDKVIGGSMFLCVETVLPSFKSFLLRRFRIAMDSRLCINNCRWVRSICICIFSRCANLLCKEKSRFCKRLVFHRNCIYAYHIYYFLYW